MLVDKPAGPTSHDVVDAVRRATGIRRVGHAGTLDPPATGLVVVAVGPATRLLRFVGDLPKTYETRGVLGVRTSTLDADGEVLSTETVDVSRADLEAALERFRGEIEQVPPQVSAVKVGGERAYKRAARGEHVEIEPRRVVVHELELVGADVPSFSLRIRCSSGTYVRSLVRDIGDVLGPGAHVETLRRTSIGHLDVGDAVPMADVASGDVVEVERVLSHLPRVELDAETSRRARNGQTIEADGASGEVLVQGPDGAVGVFRAADGILRPVTVLPTGS